MLPAKLNTRTRIDRATAETVRQLFSKYFAEKRLLDEPKVRDQQIPKVRDLMAIKLVPKPS
jgi:hypothetical protein